MSLCLATTRSRLKNSRSAVRVMILSFVAFTSIFFTAELKVFIFNIGNGSQKLSSLVLIFVERKSSMRHFPISVASRRGSGACSGRTTPVAMIKRHSFSDTSQSSGIPKESRDQNWSLKQAGQCPLGPFSSDPHQLPCEGANSFIILKPTHLF